MLCVELGVVLLNLEVYDRSIEVHFGHCSNWRADVVRCHCDVLGLGDDRYFLQLSDSTGIGDIGLQHVGGVSINNFCEREFCVQPLAGCNRDVHLVSNF